jgi:predicted GIY-YIG superfamily endonuclease
MGAKRNTHVYSLWDSHRKVYIGTTEDPEVREAAHSQDKKFTRMELEGPAISRDTALNREQEALDRYRRGHGGKLPKYND